MRLIKISLLEVMRDRANSPELGETKPSTEREGFLTENVERIQTHSKVRVERKVSQRRSNTP